jgi:hypothetical protein
MFAKKTVPSTTLPGAAAAPLGAMPIPSSVKRAPSTARSPTATARIGLASLKPRPSARQSRSTVADAPVPTDERSGSDDTASAVPPSRPRTVAAFRPTRRSASIAGAGRRFIIDAKLARASRAAPVASRPVWADADAEAARFAAERASGGRPPAGPAARACSASGAASCARTGKPPAARTALPASTQAATTASRDGPVSPAPNQDSHQRTTRRAAEATISYPLSC